jgi:hypothetical protein
MKTLRLFIGVLLLAIWMQLEYNFNLY